MLQYLAQSAVGGGVDPAAGVSNLSADDVGVIFERFSTWLFSAFLIVAILFIIIAAFRYATASDKKEGVSSANRALVYAIVAVLVAFLSKGLTKLVMSLITG